MNSEKDIESLTELLGRLEGATTWYDRSTLDRDLATSLGLYIYERRGRDTKAWYYPTAEKHAFRTGSVPAYTASLDAALALCERIFGHAWALTLYARGAGQSSADFNIPHITGSATAATPALALLAAMLKALIAQKKAADHE